VGLSVSGKEFRNNLISKLTDNNFTSDISPLISPELNYSVQQGFDMLDRELISKWSVEK